MLAGCQCPNITEYYSSMLQPGSTELMIVMELLACSVADLVSGEKGGLLSRRPGQWGEEGPAQLGGEEP